MNGAIGFHATKDDAKVYKDASLWGVFHKAEFSYTLENFFHPFVEELLEQINKQSLPGLFDPQFHENLGDVAFTPTSRMPGVYYQDTSTNATVETNFQNKKIDVTSGGPYANYNWELFFHVPLAIATHLSKNQRFPEAQRWFHFIFNPTANDLTQDPPERFWNFLAFRDNGEGRQIDQLLALLSKPDSELTAEALATKNSILNGYQAIKNKPFQPHAVARTRHLAYMYNVVMKYLDNLIAWGDHLFRQDTIETINEATQLYVLASNVLGQRPEQIPLKGRVQPKTFAQLKTQGLDQMGNALVDLEGLLPFNFATPTGAEEPEDSAPLFGLGRTLYFCVPKNEKLLSYWDTVADRLFKIRHCMNIEGVVRSLALFDPPLDPGMLVKAGAAGIDIGTILSGVGQPVGPVRARVLIQKALELSIEVRGLGASLLQAIEKEDSEKLALLRQGHEKQLWELQREVRFIQWKQSQESTESLLKSRSIVLERYRYFLRLVGQAPDEEQVPSELPIDRRRLTEENFDEAYEALVGQYDRGVQNLDYPDLSLVESESPSGQGGANGPGNISLITSEKNELDSLTSARDSAGWIKGANTTAAILNAIPDASLNFHYWGLGGAASIKVGSALSTGARAVGDWFGVSASEDRDVAGISSRTSGYSRREDDWTLQINLATNELHQIGRQIITSLITEQITQHDYENTVKQGEQTEEVNQFLENKFTNEELYGWMHGELSNTFYNYYQFAFDVAKRAEQTMKHELNRPELDSKTLIKFNYWDGGRKGLLSGETLNLDVKRMEMEYIESNLREYELTKHISLLQINPFALVELRNTGRCSISLPEECFDMDGPGQYFRRIKQVELSVPCVTGPYTGINCKLTLTKSSIRKKTSIDNTYARDGADDSRFQDYYGSIKSVVTSSGVQDSGLFVPNSNQEHYLPFENAGVISDWQLELPGNPSQDDPTQFDYQTIADAILHIRYTARDGGATLRSAAIENTKDLIASGEATGLVRLFSIRDEFPTEWVRFKNNTPATNERHELSLDLQPEHYPFWSQGRLNSIESIDIIAESSEITTPTTITISDRADQNDSSSNEDTLTKNSSMNNLLHGSINSILLPATPTDTFQLYFDNADISDLLILVKWNS